MIKYLQKVKARKGFTLVEIIIVITIIAILAAITIPMFNNTDARVRSANIYANDFYTALQYTLTRYQTTDYYLSPKMKTETSLMTYDQSFFGNRMADGISYYYIEAMSDQGLQYVHVNASYLTLMGRSSITAETELERLLTEDVAEITNQSNDGYYYAVVGKDSYNNMKVLCVNYCEERLVLSGSTGDYQKSIMLVDYGILENGIIAGTCSSQKDPTGKFLGDIGTYVCGLDSTLNYAGVSAI